MWKLGGATKADASAAEREPFSTAKDLASKLTCHVPMHFKLHSASSSSWFEDVGGGIFSLSGFRSISESSELGHIDIQLVARARASYVALLPCIKTRPI